MPYGRMTVGDLRKACAGLPDDAPLLVRPHDEKEFNSHEAYTRRDRKEIYKIAAAPAKTWDSNTREIHNIYTANDDRYDQNTILLLEIGEPSP